VNAASSITDRYSNQYSYPYPDAIDINRKTTYVNKTKPLKSSNIQGRVQTPGNKNKTSGLPPFSPAINEDKQLLIQNKDVDISDKELVIKQKEEIDYLKRQFQLIKASSDNSMGSGASSASLNTIFKTEPTLLSSASNPSTATATVIENSDEHKVDKDHINKYIQEVELLNNQQKEEINHLQGQFSLVKEENTILKKKLELLRKKMVDQVVASKNQNSRRNSVQYSEEFVLNPSSSGEDGKNFKSGNSYLDDLFSQNDRQHELDRSNHSDLNTSKNVSKNVSENDFMVGIEQGNDVEMKKCFLNLISASRQTIDAQTEVIRGHEALLIKNLRD
jgi:hypothetical protein